MERERRKSVRISVSVGSSERLSLYSSVYELVHRKPVPVLNISFVKMD